MFHISSKLGALALCLALAPSAFAQAPATTAAPAAAPKKSFKILQPGSIPDNGFLPSPPVRGSAEEKLELDYLHALIKGTSPARMEQAVAGQKFGPKIRAKNYPVSR